MFTHITLKNYKSLVDFDAKLTDKMIIVGNPSIGKTNFIDSLYTLGYLTYYNGNFKRKTQFKKFVISCKTLNSKGDNILLSYTFIIDNKKYIYTIVIDDTKIINEVLKYNDEVYFNVTSNNVIINRDILIDDGYYSIIMDNYNKHWGYNTILSIISKDIIFKSNSINNFIKPTIIKIVKYLNKFSLKNSYDFISGWISKDKENKLDKWEFYLNSILVALYADIKEVYYSKMLSNDTIIYNLYIKKLLGGKIFNIPAYKESRGTKLIIDVLSKILHSFKNHMFILDDFSDNIHDLLTSKLIYNYFEQFLGQAIIITNKMDIKSDNIDIIDFIDKYLYKLIKNDTGNKTIIKVVK